MKKILFILIMVLVFIGVFSYIQYNSYNSTLDNEAVFSNINNILNSNDIISKNETINENSNVNENLVDSNLNKLNEDSKNNNDDSNSTYNNYYSLDTNYFLIDAENYNPDSNRINISEEDAKKIAEIGFNESAERIAGEGVENKESERVKIEEKYPNNYFTRQYLEGDKMFKNILRNCFVVTRENDMGCGVSIYVDVTTGLIIGGAAFGD